MIREDQLQNLDIIEYTPDPIDQYVVIVNLPEDWDEVHNYIINENEIDGIPNRRLDCINEKPFSLRTSTYMMSAEEAELLKTHPKVENVALNPEKYIQPLSLYAQPKFGQDVAWPKPSVTAARSLTNYAGIDIDVTFTNNIRSNWSHSFVNNQTSKPWQGVGITTAITADFDINYSVTGKNVDAVIIDSGIGVLHPDFIAPDGSYRVFDVILDGPAKADTAAFASHLENVFVEGVNIGSRAEENWARKWWSDTSIRSSAFQSLGTLSIPSTYTRDHAHTAYTATNAIISGHGSACASQIGGKYFGLATECNLWNVRISLGGVGGVISSSIGIEACAIWHSSKKIASNDPDPTIVNMSFGATSQTYNVASLPVTHNYRGTEYTYNGNGSAFIRQANSGSARNPKNFNIWDSSFQTVRPLSYGSGQYPSSSLASGYSWLSLSNTACEDAISAGCILASAAGNHNQKLSDKSDVDYDNWYLNDTFPLNRVDGAQKGFSGDDYRDKGVIRVGALDCAVEPYDQSGGINKQGVAGYKVRKVCYSANGPMIDIWAPAEATMSAGYANYQNYARLDNSNFYDTFFGGTSSACPNACSVITLYLEGSRGATQDDVRNWLDSDGSKEIDLSDPVSDINDEGYWGIDFNASIDGPKNEGQCYNSRGSGNLRGATKRVLHNPFAIALDPPPDGPDLDASEFTLKGTSFTVTGDDLTIKLS